MLTPPKFAVESQILHHNLNPAEDMILINPVDPSDPILPTQQILDVIDKHATTTALLLLPGVQFYSGQYFDMKTITAHAHSKGIMVGWDCAHAVGNVDMKLHEWDVDFAAWCNYKYLNSGPGAIGGIFVHEKHGKVEGGKFRPRLAGWWGGDKSVRFKMDNTFQPMPGAAGYQISNTSALDCAPVMASLAVFNKTSITEIRKKSLLLTGYLEHLLLTTFSGDDFKIITPADPKQRGAQLSIRLVPGLLDTVMEVLDKESAVTDERKPDVVRVAPAPLYSSFVDVWLFVEVFRRAMTKALEAKKEGK
jgi:kynureninase